VKKLLSFINIFIHIKNNFVKMHNSLKENIYRNDIDGLRAISVIVVILFHFGVLEKGYLGVDVFFVISGFLITKFLYNDTLEQKLSLKDFYLRRIRRILPLVFFINTISLLIGLFVMLPDDLENLCQSIIATNFFSNNILQYVTTKDYWNIVNEYKPLMHTWSLGIEEQFYVFYPILFILFSDKRIKYLFFSILFFSILSLILFIFNSNEFSNFYLIPCRFFELAIGGIASIIFNNFNPKVNFKIVLIFLLISLLVFNFDISNRLLLIIVVLLSTLILIFEDKSNISTLFLENKIISYVGKISFSLYMWHQFIFAYTRYCYSDNLCFVESVLIFILIFILSVCSYKIIEQPFRNKNTISTKLLLNILLFFFVITSIASYLVYLRGGIIKDFTELDISKGKIVKNIHSSYVDRIYNYKHFSRNNKIKVIIVGNSFARDWANILLESDFKNQIDIIYNSNYNLEGLSKNEIKMANIVFFSELDKDTFIDILKLHKLDTNKIYNVGTKNFGNNNGIIYNNLKNYNYCSQKIILAKKYLILNEKLKKQWGDRYIDIIGLTIDSMGKIPVFTSNCKFISQDCKHLTKSGAIFYSRQLKKKLNIILKK
jgi:peptidoglycan/LPS O-acetylase OafA/YrhL